MSLVKLITLFLFFGLINHNCAQTIEDRGLNCIQENFAEKGVQIDSVLDSYEKFLVKEGYLVKNEKLRYHTFFKKMVEKNAFIATVPNSIADKVLKLEPDMYMGPGCYEKIDELDKGGLAIALKINLLRNNILEAEAAGVLDQPKDVGLVFLETFDEEDFKSPFFKTLILLLITSIAELEESGPHTFELLPPIQN